MINPLDVATVINQCNDYAGTVFLAGLCIGTILGAIGALLGEKCYYARQK